MSDARPAVTEELVERLRHAVRDKVLEFADVDLLPLGAESVARACLAEIEAAGLVIVPKPVWDYERGKPVAVTECPYCRATDGRHYNSCQRHSGTTWG